MTGLNFAGDNSETVANPLYLAGWTYLGTVKLDGGYEIPMFDDSGSKVPTIPLLSGNELFTNDREESLRIREEQISMFQTGGLAFVGEAHQDDRGWVVPPPPPVTQGAETTKKYLYKEVGEYNQVGQRINTHKYYLCFG